MKKAFGMILACVLILAQTAALAAEGQEPTTTAWRGYELIFVNITEDAEQTPTTDKPTEGEKFVMVDFDGLDAPISRDDAYDLKGYFLLLDAAGNQYESIMYGLHGFEDGDWRYGKTLEGFGPVFSVPQDTELLACALLLTPEEGADPVEFLLSDVILGEHVVAE